ncbi:HEAT repeat domain-containing protein [Aquabacterium sp.]|uniref:HEAT repeat domain-containing protein n=1 Tax=Aquabacterium sp. TaxID=1872578 RepID=UPI0035B4EAB5
MTAQLLPTEAPPDAQADPELFALWPRLHAEDPAMRRLALSELAEGENDAHAPWLIRALSDPDERVRQEVAAALAYWELPDVIHALVASLSDPSEQVRSAAAISLAEIKQPASGALLLPRLERAEGFVLASLLHALRELRLPASLGAALRGADDVDDRVRLAAVGLLGWLKDAAALPALERLAASDPVVAVRRAAAGALGLAQGHEAAVLPALLSALQDDAWQVREEAAATLGKLRLSDSVEPLVDALSDGYWQVRLIAARALGRLRDRRATGPLVRHALSHDMVNLRKEAAIALGEIGDAEALPALRIAAEDADPEVRKMARLAMTQIAAKHAPA